MMTEERPKLGTVDLWEFDLMSEGGLLPCGNLRTLLYYMYSPKTVKITVSEQESTAIPKMMVTVEGPLAYDEKPLKVRYRVIKSEVVSKEKGLTESERAMFAHKVAERSGKLDKVVYRVLCLPKLGSE